MADIIVVVKVRPGVPFNWQYSVDGGSFSGVDTFTIDKGASPEIMVALAADREPGDTCVFAGTPLSFFDDQGIPIETPEWFQHLTTLDPSTISFQDVNADLETRTYRILINAVYNEAPVQSPDPTIVNVGTDGSRTYRFPA